MPLTKLQSEVLRLLASLRSPDSYVAGGLAINRSGPRFSTDIDLFHDSEGRLESAAAADAAALENAGYSVDWRRVRTGFREALVERQGEVMRLEWLHDSAFRFFPAQPDDLFGYVLHPVDLAANKAAAAADRREPRDVVDLVTIHEQILPLGAVICAAVGRFPGQSPEQMFADIRRHSRFTADEFRALAVVAPIDIQDLQAKIREALKGAESFIEGIPSDAVGFVFLDASGNAVQPELDHLDRYQRRAGAAGGIWPSSSEIESALLDRYRTEVS